MDYLAYERGWQSRNHKAMIDRYITRRRVLVFTITQSCTMLSTIISTTDLASRRYSLNCYSEQSAAAPCASTSSRALGQNDFTRPKAWLTYVVGASAMKLRTFYGASRSRSSRDRQSTVPPSCDSTTSTSCWAATLRSSSSFWRYSFSSPSVLIY
jgi:hypothetical protein